MKHLAIWKLHCFEFSNDPKTIALGASLVLYIMGIGLFVTSSIFSTMFVLAPIIAYSGYKGIFRTFGAKMLKVGTGNDVELATSKGIFFSIIVISFYLSSVVLAYRLISFLTF